MFIDWIIFALLFFISRVAELDRICTLILGFVGLLNESFRFLTTFWLTLTVVCGRVCVSILGVVSDSEL